MGRWREFRGHINWKCHRSTVSSFIASYREVYHRFLTHLIKISIPIFVGNNKVHIITHVLFDNSEKKIKTEKKKKEKTKTANLNSPSIFKRPIVQVIQLMNKCGLNKPEIWMLRSLSKVIKLQPDWGNSWSRRGHVKSVKGRKALTVYLTHFRTTI